MIWPFRPQPPVPLSPKVRYEREFRSIAQWLGQSRIDPQQTTILPNDVDALIADCSVEQWPNRLFHFFRARMPGSAEGMEFDWIDADDAASQEQASDGQAAAVTFTRTDDGQISGGRFHRSLAEFPYRLSAVAAMAAAVHFRDTSGEERPSGTPSAEVLPVFFGLGPVMANAALHETEDQGSTAGQGADTRRNGNVSALEYGYCMAISDWAIGTNYASVSNMLRPDAREGLLNGIRFLQKTGDCSFERESVFAEPDSSFDVVQSRLGGSSKSVLLATLLDLRDSGSVSPEVANLLQDALDDQEPGIACAAAAVLGRCSDIPEPAFEALLWQAESGTAAVSRAAVAALQPNPQHDERIKALLTKRLHTADPALATACIHSLLRFNDYPSELNQSLLKSLGRFVSAAAEDGMNLGLQLLHKVEQSPLDAIAHHFDDDPTVVAILSEHLSEA